MIPAWRLVSGRHARSGGLLPPTTLRAGGVLFFVAPAVMVYTAPWALLEAGMLFSAGITCFALARHRERSSP
jgi:hypothetical protein